MVYRYKGKGSNMKFDDREMVVVRHECEAVWMECSGR